MNPGCKYFLMPMNVYLVEILFINYILAKKKRLRPIKSISQSHLLRVGFLSDTSDIIQSSSLVPLCVCVFVWSNHV